MSPRPMSSPERPIPPYGPSQGMLQGLHLLSRLAPSEVDEEFLRQHKVAPGNEYKVIGALRFLGLIDEEGKPTEKSRLLKVRGSAYTLNLQGIVRAAYEDLFQHLNPKEADRNRIHNYFVTRGGLGLEMATKATRFFIDLCNAAQIPLAPQVEAASKRRPTASVPSRAMARPRGARMGRRRTQIPAQPEPPPPSSPTLSFVFALTPELAEMEEERLVGLLRRMSNALRRVFREEGTP